MDNQLCRPVATAVLASKNALVLSRAATVLVLVIEWGSMSVIAWPPT